MTGRFQIWSDTPSLIALLMTSADDFFWTFKQAVSYYWFALVYYIGFTVLFFLMFITPNGMESLSNLFPVPKR